MRTPITDDTMSPEQFTAALAVLGWKQSDFCRKAGVTKQTPSRWATGHTPIPAWVPAYMGAMQDLKRLHRQYIQEPGHTPAGAAGADTALATTPTGDTKGTHDD